MKFIVLSIPLQPGRAAYVPVVLFIAFNFRELKTDKIQDWSGVQALHESDVSIY